MPIEELIEKLTAETANTRFAFLVNVCTEYFGKPRIRGGHHIFKTPWPGDPRLNLQSERGKAKPYQVRQVINALKKLNDLKRKR